MTTRTSANNAAGPRMPYRGDDDIRVGGGDGTVRHFTVRHGGVTIPVSRGGRGRPLVLCPGLSSTQADLHELAGLLRREYDVVTFDLRGHGLASATGPYSFDAFLSDLTAVLTESERLGPASAPVLVGYSLGADLAVHYAAGRPDAVAGLVLVDGANPLPEPFITDADRAGFRAMWEESAARQAAGPDRGAAHRIVLTAQEIFDLNIEVDGVRSGLLARYRAIGCPISMIMSTSVAGGGTAGRVPRHNRLWRAGVERLVRERPQVAVSRLDADHRLVFTHAPEIARIIRGAHPPADGPAS
ncbi:alpha/beta fold hydrolase [Streptomyces sp. NPDC007100]|uniref:alpha/beta fold hydrolase n=1 Tax=Streptomyces sp. NPDC007100 TaxID=3155602 RepID=UPI0034113A2C